MDTDTSVENFRRLLAEEFRGDLKGLVSAYFLTSMHLVEKGGFDFVGHANKIFYNVEQCEPDLTRGKWYQKKLEDLFAFVAEKGLYIEINTKCYPQRGCFFPCLEDWKWLKQWKIPVVVNSDTHFPELVNAGRREALQALLENGFRTVAEFHGGEWQEVPISL